MVPAYISNNSIRDVVHSTENLADFCLNNLTYLIINTRIKVLFNRKQKSWSVVLVSTESNFCVGDYSKCVLMQPLVKPNHSKLIEFKAVLLFNALHYCWDIAFSISMVLVLRYYYSRIPSIVRLIPRSIPSDVPQHFC
ncbi:hypothetical protein EDC96DRAFT_550246 [Choanephora cucurbitarum]|nr:hypothetical protein EDC96DRAFT_550246 [Choanephora cucurbitarum]